MWATSFKVAGITSNYELLRDIHRLEFLRGREKHYTFADRASSVLGVGLAQPPFEAPPQVPAVLQKNWRHSFRLPMCAEPADRGLQLVVQVVLNRDAPVAPVPVSVNACWPMAESAPNERLLFPCGSLTHHTSKDHLGHDYTFPISLVREGWNEITVENDRRPAVDGGVYRIGRHGDEPGGQGLTENQVGTLKMVPFFPPMTWARCTLVTGWPAASAIQNSQNLFTSTVFSRPGLIMS